MKKAIISVLAISIFGILIGNFALAITYEKTINPAFTVNDTLTLSLSSPDLVINDLAPGNASDSNTITINVLSNNVTGYVLNSTVGNNVYNNDQLIHSSSAAAAPFSTIAYGTTISSIDNFSSRQWGYSYSLDGGTTWINANKTDGVNDSGYSGLPLYNDSTNVATLKSTNTTSPATGDNVQFKIAAKADAAQASGEYRNVVNFIAIANPVPTTINKAYADAGKTLYHGYYKIQDMSPAICSAVQVDSEMKVVDVRDDEIYLIGRLSDGNCWLLDNLRLDPTTTTLTAFDTNAPQSAIDLYQNGGTTSEPGWSGAKVTNTSSNFDSYTTPQINTGGTNDEGDSYTKNTIASTIFGNGSGEIGIYYNFCAATANTYCYAAGSGTGNANYDICPTGWRLPKGDTSSQSYDYLFHTGYESNVTRFQNALSTPISGYFYNNSATNQSIRGIFWTNTAIDNYYISAMYVYSSNVDPQNYGYNGSGYSIRCVAY